MPYSLIEEAKAYSQPPPPLINDPLGSSEIAYPSSANALCVDTFA